MYIHPRNLYRVAEKKNSSYVEIFQRDSQQTANSNSFQNIPMFLPVMRGTLSLPALRDPEVIERLQPAHVINMCSRLQVSEFLQSSIY